ncbi:hypothetical protein CEF21_07340 [Bacillus sp. FJAT-42376]|uniref:hypothetical protein n=1 Tax=Bacillus sp. FJAT-42376 TaxID=2014076 RepID=UPI000F5081D2|nr:hypothetical protein [Bacillus sp. FJAT-42376]AZB42120.1 hypothetical protein CEF21_07340 [Bacillus sp. FJAT-42376]
MKNKMKFGLISAIALSASVSFSADAASSPLSTATVAGEQLKKATASFVQTTNKGDIYAIDENYDAFTKRLSYTESTIGKVPGAAVRKSLNEKYVTPAKKAKERVIYEVSEARLLGAVSKSTIFNAEDQAVLDLQKLDRLKNRAAEIKEDGGYADVPASVTKELSWLENYFEAAAVNPFYTKNEKVVLLLENDASSKQATLGGIKIGDPSHKIELLFGKPYVAFGNQAWEYDFSETVYGGEKIAIDFKNGMNVSGLFYTAKSDKSASFSKELIAEYPGDLYQSTDAFNKELKIDSLYVLSGTGKDFVYLENSKDVKTGTYVNDYAIQDKNSVTFINVNSTEDFTRVTK